MSSQSGSICLCGQSPDPGIRPGGGCYCVDMPHCPHGSLIGNVCDQCVRESAQATFDAAGNGADVDRRELGRMTPLLLSPSAEERRYNWIVSVSLLHSYWQAELYIRAQPTAIKAKEMATVLIDELSSYVAVEDDSTPPFTVGEPQRL